MSKIKANVLTLILILSGAFCHPKCVAETIIIGDGVPIEIIDSTTQNDTNKSNSIRVELNGHFLSVVFLENLGMVTIDLETSTGGEVEATQSYTPNGVNFYIPTAGSYIIYFTLENGDVYYGEFEVTD